MDTELLSLLALWIAGGAFWAEVAHVFADAALIGQSGLARVDGSQAVLTNLVAADDLAVWSFDEVAPSVFADVQSEITEFIRATATATATATFAALVAVCPDLLAVLHIAFGARVVGRRAAPLIVDAGIELLIARAALAVRGLGRARLWINIAGAVVLTGCKTSFKSNGCRSSETTAKCRDLGRFVSTDLFRNCLMG
ncbi:MAG: hypothetical protein GY811_17015 [Myxococcales bacterium]|nr:hypothetical protein [Myxococcales bacterium]